LLDGHPSWRGDKSQTGFDEDGQRKALARGSHEDTALGADPRRHGTRPARTAKIASPRASLVKYLDTSFLIDLLRESSRRHPGRASVFLRTVADDDLRIDVHVVCELFAGAELSIAPAVERHQIQPLLADLHIVYPADRFAAEYGRLFAAPGFATPRRLLSR
jgi:hypothetical protein